MPYELQYIGAYGSAEFRAPPGLDSLTRAAGGDAFGRVSDMAMSPDKSELVVLDNVARKLVAVRSNGTPRVVLTWRQGRGPGEFTRPRGVAVNSNGFVIADDADTRLSFFSADGRFTRSVAFPGTSFQVRSDAKGLAVLRFSATPGRYQVVRLSSRGEVTDSAIPITGRIADFALYGEPGLLFYDEFNNVQFLSPAAGVVCTLERLTRCRGEDIFPQIKGHIRRMNGIEGRGANLGVRGASQLESGHTVILVQTRDREHAAQSPAGWYKSWLLILDRDMKYIGYVPAPEGWLTGMIGGFTRNELLFATDDPHPRVLRYALRRVN